MISPGEVRAIKMRDAVTFEKRIDAALKDAAENGDVVVTIGTSGVSQAVVNKVVCGYTLAGWKIEHVSDSRDGDFIRVEMP